MTESIPLQYKPYKIRFDCVFQFPSEAGNDVVQISKYLSNPSEMQAPSWWLEKHQGLLPAASNEFFADQHGNTLTIRSKSDSNLDFVCELMSEVMKRHHVQDIIHIQAGFESENGAPGRYGGIAAAIRAGDFRLLDTNIAGRDLVQDLKLAQLADECEAKYPGYLDSLRCKLGQEAG